MHKIPIVSRIFFDRHVSRSLVFIFAGSTEYNLQENEIHQSTDTAYSRGVHNFWRKGEPPNLRSYGASVNGIKPSNEVPLFYYQWGS